MLVIFILFHSTYRAVLGWILSHLHQVVKKILTYQVSYKNLNIDLGITPEKSMKLIAKCATIIAGRARVFRYVIIKTAPIVPKMFRDPLQIPIAFLSRETHPLLV